MQAYLRTDPFKPNEPQYQRGATVPLARPSDHTRELTRWALRILERLYKPGFAYQKVGVMLTELQPRDIRQGELFTVQGDPQRAERLMQTLDAVNQRWGRGTLRTLAEGHDQRGWSMRRSNLSPACTTDWEQLVAVKA